METQEQDTKFESAEVELKRLIDDVTRAMAKAQDAIARVTNRPAAGEPTPNASDQQADAA